jgi:hypothetical protein
MFEFSNIFIFNKKVLNKHEKIYTKMQKPQAPPWHKVLLIFLLSIVHIINASPIKLANQEIIHQSAYQNDDSPQSANANTLENLREDIKKAAAVAASDMSLAADAANARELEETNSSPLLNIDDNALIIQDLASSRNDETNENAHHNKIIKIASTDNLRNSDIQNSDSLSKLLISPTNDILNLENNHDKDQDQENKFINYIVKTPSISHYGHKRTYPRAGQFHLLSKSSPNKKKIFRIDRRLQRIEKKSWKIPIKSVALYSENSKDNNAPQKMMDELTDLFETFKDS